MSNQSSHFNYEDQMAGASIRTNTTSTTADEEFLTPLSGNSPQSSSDKSWASETSTEKQTAPISFTVESHLFQDKENNFLQDDRNISISQDPERQPLLAGNHSHHGDSSQILHSTDKTFDWSWPMFFIRWILFISMILFSLSIFLGAPLAYFYVIPKHIEMMLNQESRTVFHFLHIHHWNESGLGISLSLGIPLDPPAPANVIVHFSSSPLVINYIDRTSSILKPITSTTPIAIFTPAADVFVPKNMVSVNTTLSDSGLQVNYGTCAFLMNRLLRGQLTDTIELNIVSNPDVEIAHVGTWKTPMNQLKWINIGQSAPSFNTSLLNITNKLVSYHEIPRTDNKTQVEIFIDLEADNPFPFRLDDLGLNLSFIVRSEKLEPLVDIHIPLPTIRESERNTIHVRAITVADSLDTIFDIFGRLSEDEPVPVYLSDFHIPHGNTGKHYRFDSSSLLVSWVNEMIATWDFPVIIEPAWLPHDDDDVIISQLRKTHRS